MDDPFGNGTKKKKSHLGKSKKETSKVVEASQSPVLSEIMIRQKHSLKKTHTHNNSDTKGKKKIKNLNMKGSFTGKKKKSSHIKPHYLV